ncbi:D-alanyl-D-alanine carboxypeptidase/D-alanyl-D-alanine endopeptidase [Streptomyces sp. NPDC001177]
MEKIEPPTPTPDSGGRHRRPRSKPSSLAARRTLALAVVAPVAGTVFAAAPAFAAGQSGHPVSPVATHDGLDPEDQKVADNLNARSDDIRLGSNVSGFVLDGESGNPIWDHNAATALMPASNAKLATATAALTVLGPTHRFTTKVVYGDGTLTLVGGGDRALSTADLTELAKTAVAGLKAAGLDTVKVRVDDSLFPEPTLAHGWKQDYLPSEVVPVRALVVDGHAAMDTSIDAGKVFAKQLAAQGVTVDGDVTRGQASRSDVPVARHRSPQLADIVKRMLKVSDNNIAETLLRMTALASGQAPTFEGGTTVVRQVLSRHYHLPMDGFELYDGSGLSRADRIPALTLTRILELATEPQYKERLRAIRDGLPVAGEAGSSLGPEWHRFDDPNSACAVGKVAAKTGTLTGAVALSGLTKGPDGEWRVFSFVENDSTAKPDDIKDALDGLAATVNGCWA